MAGAGAVQRPPADGAESARRGRRVGIFGGSFDPPHEAHRRLARAAVEQLGLDVLHVVPCGDHPTKPREHSPAPDRLAMCEAAFRGLSRTVVDPIETAREGPSYTVDTLRQIRARDDAATPPELFLLVGSDNLDGLPRWREADALPGLATLVVYPRAGHPVPGAPPGVVADGRVRVLRTEPTDTNSTALRDALRSGERDLAALDPEVERIAVERGLYVRRDDPPPAARPPQHTPGGDGG